MQSSPVPPRRKPIEMMRPLCFGIAALALLTACDENGQFSLPAPDTDASASEDANKPATRTVERDVEAPEVFSVTDEGLWDGRPSLGGVWVAHPDVTDPERVIVRNEENGTFVIGALFRKERDLPGPALQISSDAAEALKILAGAPAKLNVTALRREETEEPVAVEETITIEEPVLPTPEEVETVDEPVEVEATSLDPIAAAGAAIDAAPETPAVDETATAIAADVVVPDAPAADEEVVAAAVEEPEAQPAGLSSLFALTKPFIEVGTFADDAAAQAAADTLSATGIIATLKPSEDIAAPGTRVVVGPATTRAERRALMKSIRDAGFTEAVIVAN